MRKKFLVQRRRPDDVVANSPVYAPITPTVMKLCLFLSTLKFYCSPGLRAGDPGSATPWVFSQVANFSGPHLATHPSENLKENVLSPAPGSSSAGSGVSPVLHLRQDTTNQRWFSPVDDIPRQKNPTTQPDRCPI
ncbi:hypothetical protein RUM43_009434 [Polyplax serrata]|uniref:Uncharacterized protein n=1 Tax=Polyplax serrata TaxID=468196 RepID=A0AAN8S8J2_POLSC